MKSFLGMLLLLVFSGLVVGTCVVIWYLSYTVEFSRKDTSKPPVEAPASDIR